MATILKFRRTAQAKASKKSSRRKRRSAEVVIFPGIRIEHWQEDASIAQGKHREPVRDMLDLIGH